MTAIQTLPFTALIYPQFDPVALQLGPLSVHWYGIGYVVSILFAWWYSKRLVANPALWANGQPPIKPLDLDDFVTWAAIGVVLGGRIGYILFYDFSRFAADPLSMFALWNGGMSYHGGMLGTILAMVLYARKRGIPVWSLLDTVAAGVPFGLGVGRLTNFVNGELWGRQTDVPWAFQLPNGEVRHASQLYEALLEGLVLFLVLRVLTQESLVSEARYLVWCESATIRPRGKMTEYFGLYALTGKVTSFVGPLAVGALTAISGSQRVGISIVVLFFVVGAVLLAGVRPTRAEINAGSAASR